MSANSSSDSAATSGDRGRRRLVQGTVISDKMDKTITVQENRLVKHPLYGKYVRRKTIYKAHDERNEAKQGDHVEIALCRPISKTKSWRLVRVLEQAERLAAVGAAIATETPIAPAPTDPAPVAEAPVEASPVDETPAE